MEGDNRSDFVHAPIDATAEDVRRLLSGRDLVVASIDPDAQADAAAAGLQVGDRVEVVEGLTGRPIEVDESGQIIDGHARAIVAGLIEGSPPAELASKRGRGKRRVVGVDFGQRPPAVAVGVNIGLTLTEWLSVDLRSDFMHFVGVDRDRRRWRLVPSKGDLRPADQESTGPLVALYARHSSVREPGYVDLLMHRAHGRDTFEVRGYVCTALED